MSGLDKILEHINNEATEAAAEGTEEAAEAVEEATEEAAH